MESKNTAKASETAGAAAAGRTRFTPTAEQIAEWKSKYGDVFVYETEDGKYAAYLRRPSRQVVDMAYTRAQGSNFKMANVIFDNCWLGGDNELRKEDKYFIGLQQKAAELIEVATGELKKL